MRLDFKIAAPKSAEEEPSSSLFLSQREADVSFKVKDQIIPAHKCVLLKKSQYFANSSDVIEIEDCEADIFRGKLKFFVSYF